MAVKLVCYSAPVPELAGHKINNLLDLIAYMARVSNPTNQFNTLTSEKLVGYLIRNRHWSPLEMVSVTMEIQTTRDIARQILRHRSFSFQEFSQRYADPTKVIGWNLKEARLQDPNNRQNSIDIENEDLQFVWIGLQDKALRESLKAYQWAIDNGIAKEVARVVLPEGLTPSTLYMAGNIRSWFHYIDLRTKNGTQKEHMQIASECAEVLHSVFPFTKFVDKEE